jgi:hypothetical protein
MGKKLEANGLWESCRMMLPQHKDASVRQATQFERLERPKLDEQEVELIGSVLKQSQVYSTTIYLSVFGEYEIRSVTGIVTSSQRDCFRLDTEDPYTGDADWEWIMFRDVLMAELSQDWTDAEMIDP